jgi:hypothetical protein
MPKFDVTKLNVAIDRLLETTRNPRHRFMLMAYSRHRYLEVAGRYEEIFAAEMMSPTPEYYFKAAGNDAALTGQDHVKGLYRFWAETNQSIFFVENEEVAVADHFIASVTTMHQQISGKIFKANKLMAHLPNAVSDKLLDKLLAKKGHKADEKDMYLYTTVIEMVWPYDDRGRLIGEDVYEPHPERAEVTKLAPGDVLTTEESGRLLAPFIKPLPSFDEMVLGKKPAAA